jgi:hypothetical protein
MFSRHYRVATEFLANHAEDVANLVEKKTLFEHKAVIEYCFIFPSGG